MLEALSCAAVHKSLDEPNHRSVNRKRKDELAKMDVAMLCLGRLLFVDDPPNSPEKPLADRTCQQTAADANWKKDDFAHDSLYFGSVAEKEETACSVPKIVRLLSRSAACESAATLDVGRGVIEPVMVIQG